MAADLADKTCIPCRGGVRRWGFRGEATPVAAPSWTLVDDAHRIERTFRFRLQGALAFVNKIGDLAETEGHHPDIHFSWGYVTVSMHTHIKGCMRTFHHGRENQSVSRSRR
jgi:4a-hydroxytetrahydrobiopterin dehydratase